VYLLVVAAFFALAALFVKACEIIIGPDDVAVPADTGATEPESLAA
jgi:hypothetical protein